MFPNLIYSYHIKFNKIMEDCKHNLLKDVRNILTTILKDYEDTNPNQNEISKLDNFISHAENLSVEDYQAFITYLVGIKHSGESIEFVFIHSLKLFNRRNMAYNLYQKNKCDFTLQYHLLYYETFLQEIWAIRDLRAKSNRSKNNIIRAVIDHVCERYYDLMKIQKRNEEAYLQVMAKDFHIEASNKLLYIYDHKQDYDNLAKWLLYFETHNKVTELNVEFLGNGWKWIDCFSTVDEFDIDNIKNFRIMETNLCVSDFSHYYFSLKSNITDKERGYVYSAIEKDMKNYYSVRLFFMSSDYNLQSDICTDVKSYILDVDAKLAKEKETVVELRKEIEMLKIELRYKPDGVGAKESEANFYSLVSKVRR